MSGIEYLNLQNTVDFMRLCRDLRKQMKQQPLEQTVMIFLMYRPEIAAFTARQKTKKSRMSQLHLDLDMTELLQTSQLLLRLIKLHTIYMNVQ